jgi:hypothetical protein
MNLLLHGSTRALYLELFRGLQQSHLKPRMLDFWFGYGGYFHDNVLNGNLAVCAAFS